MHEVRLIDANALKDTISNIKLRVKNPEMMSGLVEMKAAALREVEAAPTIEAEPVRRGRWIEATKHRDENGTIMTDYECSECFAMVKDSYAEEIESERFCYNCGARMDGGAGNG